jgi:hypothetical protein
MTIRYALPDREKELRTMFSMMTRMLEGQERYVTRVDDSPPVRTPWPEAEPERPLKTVTYSTPAPVRIHGIDPGLNIAEVTTFADGTMTIEDMKEGHAMTRRGHDGPHLMHVVIRDDGD